MTVIAGDRSGWHGRRDALDARPFDARRLVQDTSQLADLHRGLHFRRLEPVIASVLKAAA